MTTPSEDTEQEPAAELQMTAGAGEALHLDLPAGRVDEEDGIEPPD